MIHFFDASALVKRYVTEPGSRAVRTLFRRQRTIAAARIAEVEVAAALARLARAGAFSMDARDRMLAHLERDLAEMTLVELRPALIREAAHLAVRHGLRGYDAAQLAAAMAIRGESLPVTLWAADGELLAAAVREGLRTVSADTA